MTATLPTGDYLFAISCPHCGRDAEVPAVIEQVLKVKGHEGSLTVALSAKPVPHDCRQRTIDDDRPMLVDAETGEIARGVSP